MGEPDIIPEPVQALHILEGPQAEPFLTEIVFIRSFRQVGMKEDLMIAGEFCGLFHEFRGNGKRGTGRQGDPAHGKRPGIMPGLDESQGIFKNGFFLLYNIIRRKSAFGSSEGHASAGGMEPDSDLPRSPYLFINEGTGLGMGKQVKMICGGGASGKEEFAHGSQGAEINSLGSEASPDFIEKREPVEKPGILDFPHSAGQCLVKMVMGVNEARKNDHIGCINDGIRLFSEIGTDGNDLGSFDVNICILQTGHFFIKHSHASGIFYKKGFHIMLP